MAVRDRVVLWESLRTVCSTIAEDGARPRGMVLAATVTLGPSTSGF